MMYRCKILTDEFIVKLDKYIQTSTANIRDEKERFRLQGNKRRALYHMWNNPQAYVDRPDVKEYYENLGLWKPQYTEMVFVAAGKGFHIEPRITWVNQICRIADVKEIFSYEVVP